MPDDSNWEGERDAFLASHPPRHVPASVIRKATKPHHPWIAGVAGTVFLGIGLIFSAMIVPRHLPDEWRLKKGPSEKTRGSIVAPERTGTKIGNSTVWKHQFTYRAHDEEKRQGTAYLTGQRWKKGAKVDVLYLKDDPSVAMVKGSRMDAAPPWVSFVLLFPLIGVVLILSPVFRRRSVLKLLRNGVLAQAKVDRVEATSMQVNQQTVHKMTFTRIGDGISASRRIWDEAEINMAFRKLETGEPLRMIHDPGKAKRVIFPESWDTAYGMSPARFFRERPEVLHTAGDPLRVERWQAFLALPKPRPIPRWLGKERSLGKGIWFLPLFGSVFLIFGLFGAWAFLPWNMVKQWRLDLGPTAMASGKVVETFDPRASSNRISIAGFRYSFEIPGGSGREGRAYVDGKPWQIGKEVHVRYLIGDPSVSIPRGARLDVFTSGTLLVLVFPTVGFVLVTVPLVIRARGRRILRMGDLGLARVEGMEKTQVSINHQPQYAIRLARDDGSRVVHKTCRLQESALAAWKLQSAEPVSILYDPLKPDRLILVET